MKTTENQKKQEIELEIIEKLPKTILVKHLEEYAKYANLEGYLKLSVIIFPVLILIHNAFIAGNSYDYKTYNTIETTELSIVGLIVASVIVLVIIAMRINSKLKKELKQLAKKHAIKTKVMEAEFTLLAVNLYGGSGLKLK